MTLEGILQQIHIEYENDVDYPTVGDDDYTMRLALVNAAVNRWDNIPNVLWNSLFTKWSEYSVEDGETIDRTGDGTSVQFDLPRNFKFPNSRYVVSTDANSQTTNWTLVKARDRQNYEDSETKHCWVTGKPKAYKLNFSEAPGSGDTFELEYYKRATQLSGTTDVPEMEDPYFIVFTVLAKLVKDDRNITAYNAALRDAEDRLGNMIINNEKSGPYEDDSALFMSEGFGV